MGRAHARGRQAIAQGKVLAGIVLAGIVLAANPCAFALNPALDVSQYAHTPWKMREGFTKGAITAIAQTHDGYLWLGTEFGLLRFDGVRNVPWPRPDQPLPFSRISSLLVARDGTLWIGGWKGLVSWKGGKLTRYAEFAEVFVHRVLEDREGTIWVGTGAPPNGRLCAIQENSVHCHGEDGRFGRAVLSLYEDPKGNLWAGASTGLWRWKPGPAKLYQMSGSVPNPVTEIQALIEGDNGALWIALRDGITQLVDGKAEAYHFPSHGQFGPDALLRDREGSLWIGTTGQGLLHVHQGRVDVFTTTEGLSGDGIHSLFEDREGNIWVATTNGLDRFSDVAIPTISFLQGLSRSYFVSVVAARDGSVWIASLDGLNRWKNGQVTIYRNRSGRPLAPSAPKPPVREIADSGLPDNNLESIFLDDRGRLWVSTLRGLAYFENERFVPVRGVPGRIVNAIAGDTGGNVWIAELNLGLFHISGGAVDQIPWAKLGHMGSAGALAPDPIQGGLWLGFHQGGIAYWKDGQVRASYAAVDGLGSGQVNGLQLDGDGTLWAATEGGLSQLRSSVGAGSLAAAFRWTPAVLVEGDDVLGGIVTVRFLLDRNDEAWGFWSIGPATPIATPPYHFDSCVWAVPTTFWFVDPAAASDELLFQESIPVDPALVGTEFLVQALAGPRVTSHPKEAAWTNCGSLTIR